MLKKTNLQVTCHKLLMLSGMQFAFQFCFKSFFEGHFINNKISIFFQQHVSRQRPRNGFVANIGRQQGSRAENNVGSTDDEAARIRQTSGAAHHQGL